MVVRDADLQPTFSSNCALQYANYNLDLLMIRKVAIYRRARTTYIRIQDAFNIWPPPL